MLKLYSYFRSSASYRARIALHWKGLPFEYVPVHLVKDGGQQLRPEYRAINPMGHVPALDHDGFLVAETMAICLYLDDLFPGKQLFPTDPRDKALTVQLCEIVNSGIQPLQNLKVTKMLDSSAGKELGANFTKHWIADGLANLERLLARTAGSFSLRDEVTAADCFLIPQCFAARRFGIAIENYPNIARVDANAQKLAAFQKAHPEKQPDYQA